MPDGGSARIIRYLLEGFYLVETIPEGRELVGHEDDLILESIARDIAHRSGPGSPMGRPARGSIHPSFQNAEPKPTHYFDNSYGERHYGIYDRTRVNGGYFYCICNDGETWCKEPVFVPASMVRELKAK